MRTSCFWVSVLQLDRNKNLKTKKWLNSNQRNDNTVLIECHRCAKELKSKQNVCCSFLQNMGQIKKRNNLDPLLHQNNHCDVGEIFKQGCLNRNNKCALYDKGYNLNCFYKGLIIFLKNIRIKSG